MQNAAAIPAIALLAGSALGLLIPDLSHFACWLLMIGVTVGALASWYLGKHRLLASLVAIGFLAGGVLISSDAWRRTWQSPLLTSFERLASIERAEALAAQRVVPEDELAFTTIEGVLRSDASVGPTGVSLSIAVDRHPLQRGEGDRAAPSGGVLITVVGALAPSMSDQWRAGRRVRLPVTLHRPSRYLDPGVPDSARSLALHGTILVGTAKSGALVELVARGGPVDEYTAEVRAFARRAIDAAVGHWSMRSAGVVKAIVIGDRAGLDDHVERQLLEAGTYHVIAISGGNIAILAGLLLGVFRLAGLLGRTAMLASILGIVAYAHLVGGGASVDRATLMAVVYFGARAVDQRSPPPNALAFVAVLVVAADPFSVADPAFLLTFGATLAIIVAMPAVGQRQWTRVLMPVVTMLAASAAAEAVLFPVAALFFSRVTFAGLALNFLAIPLMGAAQVVGMVVVPAALVSADAASVVGFAAHLGAAGLVRSAELVQYAPVLTFRVAPPSWLVVSVYYASLVAWWTLRRHVAARGFTFGGSVFVGCGLRRMALLAAFGAAVWMLAEPWALMARRGDGTLHVTFLDVGQGDSALVRFPHGATLLVDAGGLPGPSTFDVGDRVVAPVLRIAGVRRLDSLALTHGDPDHIGGAPSIVREFRPREVWEGIPVPRFVPLAALQEQVASLGSRWTTLRSGDRRRVDEVEVAVRHPAAPDWERQRVRNDDSLVLELGWRDVSVLLTGDIGRAVERALGRRIPTVPLRVVKVPHHGSLTSSTPEFLRALAPRVAVVSVGRGNHFGHPAPEVLERYRQVGAEIFRTDRDGAVTIDTDGYRLTVKTFTGLSKTYEPPSSQRTQR